MREQWVENQERVARQLMDLGKNAIRGGDFRSAEAALAESTVILDMIRAEAVEDDLDLMKLDAQAKNEIGFILQRTDRVDAAIPLHKEAVELCNKIMEQEEFRANAAATNINLASLLAATEQFDDAHKHNVIAKELAETLIKDGQDLAQAANIAFGSNQNMAIMAARKEEWEESEGLMNQALEHLPTIREHNPSVDAQAAQGCQQLSVLLFNAEQFDRALAIGKRALEFSEKAHAVIGEPVVPVYVTSQLNLVSFYEKEGSFSDAEDCLWKSLDFIGDHPQILERGKIFYETCRKQADARLEKGNLPREEVEEGLIEINSRIEALPEEETEA